MMGEMHYLDDFVEQKKEQSNIKARVGKAETPNVIRTERAHPVQADGTGVTIKITKGSVNHAELERGGIPMPETPKDNASRPWSDELEAHKKMTDQRFDHMEKINTMQYEGIQKDMRHGFELIASRIGSLEDKIVASEKDVANKFDSFESKIILKMNEQKNELVETLRKERKDDHKYIFTSLIAIVGVAVGVLAWIL